MSLRALQISITEDYRSHISCPISHDIMTNPTRVDCPDDHTFDRTCIQQWLKNNNTCPLCRAEIHKDRFKPNREIRAIVETWQKMQNSIPSLEDQSGAIESKGIAADEAIAITLQRLSPPAVTWLQISAYLNPSIISLIYLEEWIKIAYPEDPSCQLSIQNNIVIAVTKHELQQLNEDTSAFVFHGIFYQAMQIYKSATLFQQVTRLLLEVEKKCDFRAAAVWLSWHQCEQAAEWEKHVSLWKQEPLFAQLQSQDQGMLLYKLGCEKLIMRRCQEALNIHIEALESRKQVLGPQHLEVASSLHSIGECYKQQEQMTEALQHFNQALEIKRQALGAQHLEVASALYDIATCYTQQEQMAEAALHFNQVLEIKRQVLGPQHLEIASALYDIATCYRQQEQMAEATHHFNQAIEIKKQALGPQHSDVALLLHNIGHHYRCCGQHTEALECYTQELEIKRQILGEQHLDVAQLLSTIGGYYQDLGQYPEALHHYNQELEIERQALDPHHHLAYTLSDIGKCYQRQRRYAEALQYHNQALESRNHAFGPQDSTLGYVLSDISACHLRQGQWTEAAQFYNEAQRQFYPEARCRSCCVIS